MDEDTKELGGCCLAVCIATVIFWAVFVVGIIQIIHAFHQ